MQIWVLNSCACDNLSGSTGAKWSPFVDPILQSLIRLTKLNSPDSVVNQGFEGGSGKGRYPVPQNKGSPSRNRKYLQL